MEFDKHAPYMAIPLVDLVIAPNVLTPKAYRSASATSLFAKNKTRSGEGFHWCMLSLCLV